MRTQWMNLFLLMMCFTVLACFTAKAAHATSVYHSACESLEKRSEVASEALDNCVKNTVKKNFKVELFCQDESTENLKALSDLEKCRKQNLFSSTPAESKEKK